MDALDAFPVSVHEFVEEVIKMEAQSRRRPQKPSRDRSRPRPLERYAPDDPALPPDIAAALRSKSASQDAREG